MLSDKAPFVITVILAGFAWTLTHVVDRLSATPMLLYRIQTLESGSSKKSVYITIRNITRDKTFRNVRLIITAASGDVLSDGAVIPVQPAWEGDQAGILVGRTFEYTFTEIQPNWQFEITASYSLPTHPSLRMSVSDGTLYAVAPSIETFLVEHEIEILGLMLVGWVIALGIAQVLIARWKRSDRYDS